MPVKECALCASKNLVLVVDLGMHPLADTFVRSKEEAQALPRYPLTVFRCDECAHLMNGYRVPPAQRYQETEYSYDSANSDVAVSHFKEMAGDVGAYVQLGEKDLVVDIGGNVGTLLRSFAEGYHTRILNIEPSSNIARVARDNGVPTVQRFWDKEAADEVLAQGAARVITATNVLNHIDDLERFFIQIQRALTKDGVFVAEIPYALSLIERDAFDTMYLEHVSYFSIAALRRFLAVHDLRIMRAKLDAYMGGSIRITIGRGEEGSEVSEFVDKEHKAGLSGEHAYALFRERVARFRENLLNQLHVAKRGGAVIVGVGAATKGNTLLNYCAIDDQILEYITDVSPLKVGKYAPGSGLLIRGDDALSSEVTHALVLPWNIADFLIERLSRKHPHLSFIVPHVA